MGASLQFVPAKDIPLSNAWVARVQIRVFSFAANDWLAWSGSDARVRYSIYPTGYDPDGYPSTLIGPYTLTETDVPGWYAALVSAEDVDAGLAAYLNQTVYEITEGAYGTSAYGLTSSQPLTVVNPRPPIQT